jgi:hypothetical protein
MKKIIFIALLFLSFQSYAGSNVAYLVCKSASGRTMFKAELQDIMSFENGTFTIDGKSISYNASGCTSIIFNAKNKVFTIYLDEDDGEGAWLTFYAIPETFNEIKGGEHDQHYKFKAIIQGKDPRPDKYNSPEIELDCELTYSI